jgi:hypothetical protein
MLFAPRLNSWRDATGPSPAAARLHIPLNLPAAGRDYSSERDPEKRDLVFDARPAGALSPGCARSTTARIREATS